MRKILFLLFVICCTCTKAQLFTKSYSAVKNYSISSMGVIQGVPMGAQYIDFYDNYIVLWGFGNKYVYKTTNLDGSRQYVPVKPTGYPVQEVGIIISKDCSYFKHIQQMPVMNMTVQMITEYSWIGDGAEPAQSLLNSYSNTYVECSSCRGTGNCKFCQGTGRDEYTRNGRCGVCRGTGRCAGCNGKGSL